MNNYDFTFLLDQSNYLPNTKELIKSYDAVVAEISYPSIGTGIEIGWADAFRVPLILIHKEDFRPAPYYNDLSKDIIKYVSTKDMLIKLDKVFQTVFPRFMI